MRSLVAVGDPVCQDKLRRRATFRQLRLHACGSMRLDVPAGLAQEWLDLLAVAERFADGKAEAAELEAARAYAKEHEPPQTWRVDIKHALGADDLMAYSKRLSARPQLHFGGYSPPDSHHLLVLARYRLFEELIGPDPPPAFTPEWRTDTAAAIARGMYESHDFAAMPILADALQDAGCDNTAILDHCRDAGQVHVRGCWAVDLVLGKS